MCKQILEWMREDEIQIICGGVALLVGKMLLQLHKRRKINTIPWRRAWQPTPVSLPGEAHGQRSLAGSMGLQRVRYD